MTSSSDILKFSVSTIDEFKNLWEQEYPNRAEGGLQAISGFEHQFLLTLLKIVHLWKKSTESERQDSVTSTKILTEAISDITESEIDTLTFIQVKRTLSSSAIDKALEELWDIFNLALNHHPNLIDSLRFVISGKIEDSVNPTDKIAGWGNRKHQNLIHNLTRFKQHVSYEIVSNPREDLVFQLRTLALDENSETTISRWLGYLLQLGSGSSSESISRLIWQELIHDPSLKAFRSTIARLFSLSHSRLGVIRATLGDRVTLPVSQLSNLQTSISDNNISLLIGSSGAGKSALCKIGIQQHFKESFDCLLLQAADVFTFTESSDVTANRGLRRLDELLIAGVIKKPVLIVIDDLSDADDSHFEAVLNLLKNTLTDDTRSTNVRFILIAHLNAKQWINEKIAARFGNNFVCPTVELPQLPIRELQSCNDLPTSIISLIDRHREFGPALNLKLVDWLVRRVQQDQLDVSVFRNDLDLLAWFWHNCIRDGQDLSDSSQALIKIAGELATRFAPDLPVCFNSSIKTETLRTLVRRDCLRVVNERLAVTHRFVGDCARFQFLRTNIREIECQHLVEYLKNPFWVQPIRWLMLQLAMNSPASETWEELIIEALDGEYLQLLDLLLDGAILSKQPGILLDRCPNQSLPFIIKRLITRLLAIATDLDPLCIEILQSVSLSERIAIEAEITGIPKADLWEPVWCWLLAQTPEVLIAESCIFFKAAEVWLSWSVWAERFPLRSDVANLTLDLVQRVISEKRYYYLGNFESNAFACIIFTLRIVPERGIWLLRVLAGREIVIANQLEPIIKNSFLPGVRVLGSPHPKGPQGKVNNQFRAFMLKQGGRYLNRVVRVDTDLGAELLLALTIAEPQYPDEFDNEYRTLIKRDYGTVGSDDIDVCTFKFLPLLSLLEINEKVAIDAVEILCEVVTRHRREMDKYLLDRRTCNSNEYVEKISFLEEIDTYELILNIGNNRKQFYGSRKNLCWYQSNFAPSILTCFLMTIEGWLYSRPTRIQLEHSIDLIFKNSSSVAMIGILVTLARCDFSLLTKSLLPLASSLQLLVWLETETNTIAYSQDSGFDYSNARRNLSKIEQQELLDFCQLSHRETNLLSVLIDLWVNNIIPLKLQSEIIEDWDSYQLALIPEVIKIRALTIRAYFERNNWQKKKDDEGQQVLNFVSTLPEDDEENRKIESLSLHIPITCRAIIDGRKEKTEELHDKMCDLLNSIKQLKFFRENLDSQSFENVIWAATAIVLEHPTKALSQEIQTHLKNLTNIFSSLSISLNRFSHYQSNDLDANNVFTAHIAPILIRRLQSDVSIRTAAFRCLIRTQDIDTFTFIRSWIREYGFEYSLTQQLINVAPIIARLIILTCRINNLKTTKFSEVCPPHHLYYFEDINVEISKIEDSQVEKAWLILESNFVNNQLKTELISDTSEWIPEILIQYFQTNSDWLREEIFTKGFDWEFLNAVTISILKIEVVNKEFKELADNLCEQVFFYLLDERRKNCIEYEKRKDDCTYQNADSGYNEPLHDLYSKFTQLAILTNKKNIEVRINQILNILKKLNLLDCNILEEIIHILAWKYIDKNALEAIDISLTNRIAFKIGEYLLSNQAESNFKVIGEVENVWKKLVELILRGTEVSAKFTEQHIIDFFEKFKEALFPDWLTRKELYQTAKLSQYKKFRRIVFEQWLKKHNFLTISWSDEDAITVQVLAELWDSDCQWLLNKQSRLNELKKILEPLQETDKLGARNLADKIANFLSNTSI
jgi:energy-coupling factor transporter ATP-binding protein EcfA2